MAGRLARWWRGLDPRNRKWLVLRAVIVTAVINFIVSGLIGWMNAFGSNRIAVWSIPLFERTSLFTCAIGTFFFLPLITCVLCTLAVRGEQRRRSLPYVAASSHPLVARLPAPLLWRGLALGAALTILLTPATALVLAVAGIGDMSRFGFALYAALLAVVLGLFVTPLLAVLAMSEKAEFRDSTSSLTA